MIYYIQFNSIYLFQYPRPPSHSTVKSLCIYTSTSHFITFNEQKYSILKHIDPVTNCMEGWVEDLNDSNQIKIELHQLASRENAGYNYLVEICKELCHGEVVKEQDDKEQGEQQTTKYCVAKTGKRLFL